MQTNSATILDHGATGINSVRGIRFCIRLLLLFVFGGLIALCLYLGFDMFFAQSVQPVPNGEKGLFFFVATPFAIGVWYLLDSITVLLFADWLERFIARHS